MLDKISPFYLKKRKGHAFLIAGLGKDERTLLKEVQQFFLCQAPTEKGACKKCRSCELFILESHPDHRAYGEDENVSIDDIRHIHEFLQKTAHQNGVRLVTVYDVDSLSIYAANALLKNLEEPPLGGIFLLIAAKRSNVLKTIQSRCICIQLPKLKRAEKEYDPELKEALFGGNTQLFYQENVAKILHNQTKETLYLFYYWVAEYCRSHASDAENLGSSLAFLDVILDSIQSLSMTGINKGLMWESLMYQWDKINDYQL